MTIAEINRLARRAGVSYGRYVFMCGLGSPGAPGPGQKLCLTCGSAYAPTGGRSLYCSSRCRSELRNARRRQRSRLRRAENRQG